ncbi:glycosyltransferase family 4 protein [uncultured Parvibaculum sp.]|uniref:glycosyltransferase family 4 protein n=1 Tax=uncultured Parvibaculum sp. TaxID=291828 RepID=UPI0030EF4000|tara:strand:- start:10966 stop:12177 length:1212 start_codon:yes stop_codon:yes gene_type:complete
MPVSIPSRTVKPTRVLHVMRLPMGGLFRHVHDLVAGQQAAGIAAGVVCATPPNDGVSAARIATLEARCGLGLHVVPMSRLPGFGDLSNMREVGALIARLQPDVIHGHGAKGGLLARLVPAGKDAVRIYTPHGGTLHYSGLTPHGFAFLAAERLMRGRTDGFIFESEFSRTSFIAKVGKPGAATAVIHNGLARDEFLPVGHADGAADFLFIGELRMLKGVSTLIEAMRLLGRPAHLIIVGEGPDRAHFETLAQSLPPVSKVSFLGAMPARAAFRLARVVVMPSWNESLPYVALEAAAAGVPLVATRVGGVPEIFGSEAHRLVPAGDATALSRALAGTLAEPGAISASAMRLQARVARMFSVTEMVSAVNGFYGRIVEAKRARLAPAGDLPLIEGAGSRYTGAGQ